MFASTTVGFCRPLRGGELLVRRDPDGLRVLQGPGVQGRGPVLARQAIGARRLGRRERGHSGEVAAVAATLGGGRNVHALRVGCVALGEYLVTLTGGNKPSHALPRPRSVLVMESIDILTG